MRYIKSFENIVKILVLIRSQTDKIVKCNTTSIRKLKKLKKIIVLKPLR